MPQRRQHLARFVDTHRRGRCRLLCDQAIECAEQFAHGADRQLGHCRKDLRADGHLTFGNAARQDRETRFVVRRADIDDEAAGWRVRTGELANRRISRSSSD